jgi:hypothetical protein
MFMISHYTYMDVYMYEFLEKKKESWKVFFLENILRTRQTLENVFQGIF